MMQDNTKTVIEALLFASDRPLSAVELKNILGLDTQQIRQTLQAIAAEYENNNRGMRITEIAGGFRMITPPELSLFIRKLYKQRRLLRLSKPALETLAIVAYKQPLAKAEIQSLRNVDIDGVLNNLLEKNFIRVVGRKNTPGRPFVFGTTKGFLEYFGLNSLDELPKIERFSELKPVEEREDGAKQPA